MPLISQYKGKGCKPTGVEGSVPGTPRKGSTATRTTNMKRRWREMRPSYLSGKIFPPPLEINKPPEI